MNQYQQRNQLLPRTDKYKDLLFNQQVPKTTESKIIIPCLNKTFGFKTNEYKKNQKLLEGIIEQANNIVEEEMIIKDQKQNQPFFSIISILLKLSIGISLIGFLLLASIVYNTLADDISYIIMNVTVALISISSVIAVLCPIYLHFQKYATHNYEQCIKSKLDKLAIEENQKNHLEDKEYLKWTIQKNFFWIQLHIDRATLTFMKSNNIYQVEKQSK